MTKVINTESRSLEYKRKYTSNILKTVCAFANYNDGEILIGIDDNLDIVGVDDPEYLIFKLKANIDEKISPKPYYEIKEKEIDGKTIIVLLVRMGEKTPYLYKNKAYKRVDASTIAVDIFDFEQLILNGRIQGYDEVLSESKYLEFEYLNSILREKLGLSTISKDILKTLGLINNERYTNAAVLISDNNSIEHSGISLIRFEGNNVNRIKERISLKNISIIEMFDKTINFYKKHINTIEIINDSYRCTIDQVPFITFREAVANAIVHRDYTSKAENRVEIYDNRIEIISPGGLPIGISESEYIDGRISVSRNKILSDIFFRLGIIERLATGIRRIKENYKEFNLKPEFFILNNSIKIVLPYIILDNSFKEPMELDDIVTKFDLTDTELAIVDYIKQYDKINRVQAETILGLSKTYTIQILNSLISKNIIRRVGKGRNTIYVMIN